MYNFIKKFNKQDVILFLTIICLSTLFVTVMEYIHYLSDQINLLKMENLRLTNQNQYLTDKIFPFNEPMKLNPNKVNEDSFLGDFCNIAILTAIVSKLLVGNSYFGLYDISKTIIVTTIVLHYINTAFLICGLPPFSLEKILVDPDRKEDNNIPESLPPIKDTQNINNVDEELFIGPHWEYLRTIFEPLHVVMVGYF